MIILAVLILVSVNQLNSEGLCSDVDDTLFKLEIKGKCVFVPNTPHTVTWYSAHQICPNIKTNATLLSVESEDEHKDITEFLSKYELMKHGGYWTGGIIQSHHWHWRKDKRQPTQFKECCLTRRNATIDFNTVFRNSAIGCWRVCGSTEITQIYLQNRRCVCRSIECERISDDSCRVLKCPGEKLNWCGNYTTDIFSIYSIPDNALSWSRNPLSQPDYPFLGDDCATVSSSDKGRLLYLTSQHCLSVFRAVCEYDFSNKSKCNMALSQTVCFSLSTKFMTWFEASIFCEDQNGLLAHIDRKSFTLPRSEWSSTFWIGLWRLEAQWDSGKDILYGASSIVQRGCLLLTGEGRLKVAHCKKEQHFICEYGQKVESKLDVPVTPVYHTSPTAIDYNSSFGLIGTPKLLQTYQLPRTLLYGLTICLVFVFVGVFVLKNQFIDLIRRMFGLMK